MKYIFDGVAEEVPSYALPDDRVVEIQGEVGKVLKAMEMVVSHLRKFLVDRSILPMFEINVSRSLSSFNLMEDYEGLFNVIMILGLKKYPMPLYIYVESSSGAKSSASRTARIVGS